MPFQYGGDAEGLVSACPRHYGIITTGYNIDIIYTWAHNRTSALSHVEVELLPVSVLDNYHYCNAMQNTALPNLLVLAAPRLATNNTRDELIYASFTTYIHTALRHIGDQPIILHI